VRGFLRLYFDRIYNPIYDRTTATLNRYRQLQAKCLAALELQSGSRLLCVGLGTGGEAVAALRIAPQLALSGIDFSTAALERSRRKLERLGQKADLQLMDAAELGYAEGSFDRALCVHLLDFVPDAEAVVHGILRVLAPGGRFVFTLPSHVEGAALGAGLAKDEFQAILRSGRTALSAIAEIVSKLFVGLLYLPLMLRSERRFFTRDQIQGMFSRLPVCGLAVEEEKTYQDFIVSGMKGRN
jgi:ubiquinone/menaquinone biosynthesis C-methylase UbiE